MRAGYSARPLASKLGIAPQNHILLIGAPTDYLDLLEPLPEQLHIGQASIREVSELDPAPQSLDYIQIFTKDRAELAALFPTLMIWVRKNGMVWVSWPKRAAKVPTDLDENIVREIGLDAGMVDVKVAAIDSVWSGLKFVYRLVDRS